MPEAFYEAAVAGKAAEAGTSGLTEAVILPSSTFRVFELDDANRTQPLTLKTENGLNRTSIASSSIGAIPAMSVVSPNFEHLFVSGDFVWRRSSFDAARNAVAETVTAVASSAADAADSAQSARDAASLVGAPADQIMATTAANPATQFATRLCATYGGGARATREPAGSVTDVNKPVGDARRYAWEANPNAAAAAIRELITHQTGRVENTNRIIDDIITIPAGTWTVTEIGAFLRGPLSGTGRDGRRHRGLIIQGMGRYTTRIIFDPATDGYLFDNQDRISRMLFRDITFTGGSSRAGFMNSLSNGGPQALFFERVVWDGQWKYGFHLTGMDVNSEFVFQSCKVNGNWDTFFMSDNFQALNHNFIATDIEINTGTAIHYKQGGHCNVFGGSWIGGLNDADGTGAFVKLDGPGGMAINRFHMEGVRLELRSAGYKLIESSWPSGNISFKSVHDVGYQSDTATTAIRARFTGERLPIISWESCYLSGRHEYVAEGQADNFARSVNYEDSNFRHHSSPETFIVSTLAATAAGGNAAHIPVNFDKRCVFFLDRASGNLTDHTHNGTRAKNAVLKRRTVSIKASFGGLPGTAIGATPVPVSVKLPLNAIVTGVRTWAPAGSTTAVSTTWSHELRNGETILASLTSGAAMSAGYNIRRDDLFHVCSNEALRSISFVPTAGTSGMNEPALFLIDYLA